MSKKVMQLQSLLEETKAELGKKNDELNGLKQQLDIVRIESQSHLNETKAELGEKNDELNELRRQHENIKTEMQILSDETKAELAKKNDELNKSRQQLNSIIELLKKNKVNLEEAKSDPPLVETNSDLLGFCFRMNRTYVNSEGDYIKFQFTAINRFHSAASNKIGTIHKPIERSRGKIDKHKIHNSEKALDASFGLVDLACEQSISEPLNIHSFNLDRSHQWSRLSKYLNLNPCRTQLLPSFFVGAQHPLYYLDGECCIMSPFKRVQYDVNQPEQEIVDRRALLPERVLGAEKIGYPGTWIVKEPLAIGCAFNLDPYSFVGNITRISDTFRNNAVVKAFFNHSQHGKSCYVDALGTTFFVLETEKLPTCDTNVGTPVLL